MIIFKFVKFSSFWAKTGFSFMSQTDNPALDAESPEVGGQGIRSQVTGGGRGH